MKLTVYGVLALALLFVGSSFLTAATTVQDLRIGGYALVSKTRVGPNHWHLAYTAKLTNRGTTGISGATGKLRPVFVEPTPRARVRIRIVDRQLSFGPVVAEQTVTSTDTFTLRWPIARPIGPRILKRLLRWNITIANAAPVSQPPAITSAPVTTATVGQPYSYDVEATDPESDTLTYSLTVSPSGMTINSTTGLIGWTPDAAGDAAVTVQVTDNKAVPATQSFTVLVAAALVPVPDVVGQTRAAAEPAIIAADLTVGTVTEAHSDTVPAGQVISQNPSTGSTVTQGTAVNLVVSLGPAGGGTGMPATGFELRLGSPSIDALQDSDGRVRVQVERKQGFAGAIEVSLASPPAGVSAGTVVVEAGEEARLPLRITADVAVGPLMLTVSGVGGGVTVTANLEVNVGAAQPRSQALIQAALDAGQIDYGTSLVYRAYAVFGDPRLPEAFVGSGPAEEDIGLFVDIERDRATLSAAVLDQLQPFLLRPDDPLSFFNAGRPTNRASRPINRERSAALLANDVCSGATREWITARSTQQPVRVWTLCEGTDVSDLTAKVNLLNVLDVVDKAYGKMVTVMGPAVPDEYGDDLIDVYVVPPNEDAPRQVGDYAVEGVRGVAPPQPPFAGRTSSGYVMLPTWRLAEKDYQLTVIHELFHVLQFAHNYQVDWWFMEASATWASFHFNRTAPVRPPANSGLHKERFGGYQTSSAGLLSLDASHAYESYIWPFFMEQKGGAALVGGVWKQVAGVGTHDQAVNVLDFLFPFKDNFRKFALQNLNQPYEPGDALPRDKRYVELDNVFPDGRVPGPSKSKSTPIVVGTVVSLKPDKPVEPLAAVYFEAKVEDAAVKKIVFDLEGLRLAGVDVDALVKIDDTWESQPRDLNGKGELKFCLDRPAEKLEGIVFIVSNYQKQAGATVATSLGVKAFTTPCGQVWDGTVTARWLRSDAISTFELNTTVRATFEFDDRAEPLVGKVPYRLRNGSYTNNSLLDIFGRNPPCQTTERVSGAMLPGPPERYHPLRFGSTSANLTLFTGVEPLQYGASGLTAAEATEISNCNDNNADVTTMMPITINWWTMGGVPQPVSANGKTIAGTYQQDNGPAGTVTWTWQLTLQEE